MINYNFVELLLPDDLFEIVEEEGFWENDEYNPFFLEVNFVEGDTEEGEFLFSIQFNPGSSEFTQWNKWIALNGFDQNGYGWTEFLTIEIQKRNPELSAGLEFDPEAETCSISTVSEEVFRSVLRCLQDIFRKIDISQN